MRRIEVEGETKSVLILSLAADSSTSIQTYDFLDFALEDSDLFQLVVWSPSD